MTPREFATLCAALDDPFADREALLTDAGVPPGRWPSVKQGVLATLAAAEDAGDAAPLAEFRRHYVSARSGWKDGAPGGVPSIARSTLDGEARAEPEAVASESAAIRAETVSESSGPSAAKYVPTYLQRAPAPEAPPGAPIALTRSSGRDDLPNPDETAPLGIFVISTLPFSGSTTKERLDALARREPEDSGSSEAHMEVNPDETAMMPLHVALAQPRTGTFRDRLAPVAVPLLSLDEYADLRAELSLHGEDHAETLQRFSVSNADVHATLKAQFADYFRREPSAQARFVAAVNTKIARRRGKA